MTAVPLGPFLDRLADTYDVREYLGSDPLGLVYELSDPSPADKEIVGLLASGLAYGRVSIAQRSTRDVIARMDQSPAEFVLHASRAEMVKAFHGWVHRLNRAPDLVALFLGLQQVYEERGSLGAFFMDGYDASLHTSIRPALESFTERFLALESVDATPATPRLPGVAWFFASPLRGSACKRMNLYLRWMVRSGFPDLGLWTGVDTAHLVIPVDTHVARICRYLGFSRRKSPDWRMAEEITDGLRLLDSKDPTRFDWAISRLGILDHCPSRRSEEACATCMLYPVCTA